MAFLLVLVQPALAVEQLQPPPAANDFSTRLAQIESQLAALEAAIAVAKTNHIDTSYEKVTATTARDFLSWIRWDLAHPKELTNFTAQWWVIKSRAPELAAAIPGQEITDTLTILDRALADLARAQQNPASRRPVPTLDGSRFELCGDYWYASNSNHPSPLPVFLSSFVWMPEDAEHAQAFGRLPSFYLTLRSLPGEGQGLPPGVLQDFKRRLAAYGHSGTVFEVFLDQNPPAWAVAKSPEITKGRRQFVGYDIDHPKVRELWRRYFAEVVPLIHEAAAGRATYMLANEPHWFTTQGVWSTGPVSEYTFQHFRQWLAARYHDDIAALNQRWQRQFISFAAVQLDLPMPKSLKGSALWYDWCRFNMDRVNEWFTFLKAEIHKHDPQARCHIKLVSELCFATEFEKDNGLDFESLTREVEDISGADTAAEAPGDEFFRRDKRPAWKAKYALGWQAQSMHYDFLKSLAPGKILFDSEYHALSAESWRAPEMGPDYVRSVLWLAHLHGLGMNQAWYWARRGDSSITGQEGSAFYGSTGMQPLVLDAYGRTMKELNAFAPEILTLAHAPRPVRFFYSTDSAIQSASFHQTLTKAYEAAYFLSLPLGFVTERMLAADRPAQMRQYPLLIVPAVTHVSDRAITQLKRYADQGGTIVLLDATSLTRNEYGQERQKDALAFLKNAPRLDTDETVEALAAHFETLLSPTGIHREVICRGLDQQIPWGVRCVSARQNASMLVYLHNVGKGPQAVSLLVGSKPLKETFDLVRHERIHTDRLTLQPYEMRLLLVSLPPE